MNRLVRALLGVVVAKAAIASAWYLYQKSTENENDWKTEGESEKSNQTSVESEVKDVEVTEEKPAVVDTEVVKPKRVRKPVAKKVVLTSEQEESKTKKVRKPVAKKEVESQEKVTRSRTKKAQ